MGRGPGGGLSLPKLSLRLVITCYIIINIIFIMHIFYFIITFVITAKTVTKIKILWLISYSCF